MTDCLGQGQKSLAQTVVPVTSTVILTDGTALLREIRVEGDGTARITVTQIEFSGWMLAPVAGGKKSSGKSTTQPAVFGRIPAPCGRVPGMISRNVTACSSSRGTAPRGRARGRGQDLRAGGRVRPRPAAPAGHGRSDAGGWPAPGGRCRRAPDEDRGLRRSPRRPRRSRVWARRHQHAPGRGRAAARYQIATAQGITRSRRGPAGVFSLWPDGGGARAPRLAKRPDQL